LLSRVADSITGPDPTIFIHSNNQSTAEWLSLTHNTLSGVISTGFGALLLAPDEDLVITVSGFEAGHVTAEGAFSAIQFNGQTWSSIAATVTPTATTQNINLHESNSFVVDLESASGDVTVFLQSPQAGASYIIKVIQDSATPRDVIWPANVLWPDAVTPVISTGPNEVDIVSLFYDGTSFYATIGQNFG